MIKWNGNNFSIGNRKFQLSSNIPDMFRLKENDGFVIAKSRRYIDKYIAYTERAGNIQNVFELGIFRGGSTVFLSEFLDPKKLVAIDFNKKPVAVLSEYIQRAGKTHSVKPYYGVDQSDIPALEKIIADEFQGEQLDLVIDDASHMLEETRASFNCLFPRLRAGGLYVIEDWAWAHNKYVTAVITADNPLAGKTSLANLIFEIQLAAVSVPGLIDEVMVNDAFVVVRKGAEAADPDFDVSNYGINMDESTKGRTFL